MGRKMKRIIVTSAVSLLLLSTLLSQAAVQLRVHGQDDEIGNLIRRLRPKQKGEVIYGPSPKTQDEVMKKLMYIARRSAESRERVIHELIELLQYSLNQGLGYEGAWYAGAEMLGRLKATEAIDMLVKNLDYTDGVTGFSLGHIPAAKALIQIGEPAVPRLIEVLLSNEPLLDESLSLKRQNAARALGHIGGIQAKESLERALITEKNETVIFYMRQALEIISKR